MNTTFFNRKYLITMFLITLAALLPIGCDDSPSNVDPDRNPDVLLERIETHKTEAETYKSELASQKEQNSILVFLVIGAVFVAFLLFLNGVWIGLGTKKAVKENENQDQKSNQEKE